MIWEFSDETNEDAHDKFQWWRREHPAGFFINCESRSSGMLHRSECHHPGDTEWTRADFAQSLTRRKKICSDEEQELWAWAEKYGSRLRTCSNCMGQSQAAPRDGLNRERPSDTEIAGETGRLLVENLPTAEQYRDALARINSDLPDLHVRLLRAHYGFPLHTATATALAQAVGYEGHAVVNLQYGLLGERLRKAIGFLGEGQSSFVIASFVPPGVQGNSEWLWVMHPPLARALEFVGWVVPEFARLAEEVEEAGLFEGTVKRVTVNAYERNAEARARCIAHYGTACVVCGFDFGRVYGDVAGGFIHVHHLKPLADVGEQYEVDPVADLQPVCPNCHAVIHLGGAARSIEEVQAMIRQAKG